MRLLFCAVTAAFVSIGMVAMAAPAKNPLLAEWKGDYGGVPPFDKVKVTDMKSALEEAMSMNRKEIETIANNPKPATFENTLVAMEKMGQPLHRAATIFFTWSSSLSTPDVQAIEQEMAPKLSAFRDEFYQNKKLFERIEAVNNSPAKAKLNAEQQRLVWKIHTDFVLNGARLNDEQKKQVAELNQKLATLQTQFGQNVMADEANDGLTLTKESDLKGLPPEIIDGAAKEAADRKMTGKWFISNTRSSMEPFLTYSPNRDLREKAFRIWSMRGDQSGKTDNNKIVSEILVNRAKKAKLLGFETYAHWSLADKMAKEPQAAMDLMMKVWKPAVEQVKKEVADMQAIVDAEKGKFKIQPWDYRYYAEKVRKEKYDFDFDLVKPYLQLDHVRDAMFLAANKVFGLKFTKVTGVPVFNSNMSVYKVTRSNGKLAGLWYFDPYMRTGKRSGAWMNDYRPQHKLDGKSVVTLVSNNSNFIQGKPGEPVLLSWDDAVTMFHEFGHALHGLASNVTYPSLSGTSTAGDFVEFPSQVNENFLTTPEVLRMLVNKKGEPLPKELIAKIEKTKTFNEGFATTEFLASAIVDMKLHLADEKPIDPRKFEKDTLKELGMPSEIVMRHRIPQFNHLFSDDGYAAGYYGYLWAQVLDHDAFGAFEEAGNPYDKKISKKLNDYIFSVGNTVDPAETYRKFRGRDPEVNALLRARGFPVPAAPTVK